jgi:hypothetical protein
MPIATLNDVDPYRPPEADIQPPNDSGGERGLFSLPAIALASALGSVFAGTVLIALNYAAQKQRGTGWAVALLLGPLLTAAVVSALFIGSRVFRIEPIPLLLLALVVQPLAMMGLAAVLQGAAIAQRIRAGGSMAPIALALVIAVALLPALVLFIAPLSMVLVGAMATLLGY